MAVTGADPFQGVAEDARWLSSQMRATRCIDGEERRIFSVGSGTVLVCVPVLDFLNFLYVPQIKALVSTRRVLIYDPKVSHATRASLASRVEELRSVLMTHGVESAEILGWGDGGAIACAFAASYPAMTRGLFLLSLPPVFAIPPPLRWMMKLTGKLPLERLLPAALVIRILGTVTAGPLARPHLIRRFLGNIPNVKGLIKHSLLPILEEHSVKAGSINVPARVLIGTLDRLVSVPDAQKLVDALPNAGKLVVIEDGEHFLTYANASDVNRHLRDFMTRASL